MADNYLERREEALRTAGRTVVRRNTPSLDVLLSRSVAHRQADPSYKVVLRQLEAIASVAERLKGSLDALSPRILLFDSPLISIQESAAGVVVCSEAPGSPDREVELGVLLQSMALKAADLGLESLIVRSFDENALRSELDFSSPALAVLKVWKGMA